MILTQERVEELVRDGCMDDEKWLLAKTVRNLRQELKDIQREYQRDLDDAARDAARGAQDEATWRAVQGDEYGSY